MDNFASNISVPTFINQLLGTTHCEKPRANPKKEVLFAASIRQDDYQDDDDDDYEDHDEDVYDDDDTCFLGPLFSGLMSESRI